MKQTFLPLALGVAACLVPGPNVSAQGTVQDAAAAKTAGHIAFDALKASYQKDYDKYGPAAIVIQPARAYKR